MGEYDMQMQTTLSTLKEMHFSSPWILVMNKSETVTDMSVLPYGSVAISAKENLGIENLKREILKKFRGELQFCTLFVPYTKLNEYLALKSLITERKSEFIEEGQIIEAIVPSRYAEKFTQFILTK